jgi:hypothetical protein
MLVHSITSALSCSNWPTCRPCYSFARCFAGAPSGQCGWLMATCPGVDVPARQLVVALFHLTTPCKTVNSPYLAVPVGCDVSATTHVQTHEYRLRSVAFFHAVLQQQRPKLCSKPSAKLSGYAKLWSCHSSSGRLLVCCGPSRVQIK